MRVVVLVTVGVVAGVVGGLDLPARPRGGARTTASPTWAGSDQEMAMLASYAQAYERLQKSVKTAQGEPKGPRDELEPPRQTRAERRAADKAKREPAAPDR